MRSLRSRFHGSAQVKFTDENRLQSDAVVISVSQATNLVLIVWLCVIFIKVQLLNWGDVTPPTLTTRTDNFLFLTMFHHEFLQDLHKLMNW